MKGRHKGIDRILEYLSVDVEIRIEKLIERLRSIQPTLSHYEFILWNEVSWVKRDIGLRKFFATLILGPKIIEGKIKRKKDSIVIRQIERSIEQLEEHVPPTLVHYERLLRCELYWIRQEKNFRKIMVAPLPY